MIERMRKASNGHYSSIRDYLKRIDWRDYIEKSVWDVDDILLQAKMNTTDGILIGYTDSDLPNLLGRNYMSSTPKFVFEILTKKNVDPAYDNNILLKIAITKKWYDLVEYLKKNDNVIAQTLNSNEYLELDILPSSVKDIFIF